MVIYKTYFIYFYQQSNINHYKHKCVNNKRTLTPQPISIYILERTTNELILPIWFGKNDCCDQKQHSNIILKTFAVFNYI